MGQFYFDDQIAEVGQNSTDVDNAPAIDELNHPSRTLTNASLRSC
jgi:hypothetical protein